MNHVFKIIFAAFILSSCSSVNTDNIKSNAAVAFDKAKSGAQTGVTAIGGAGRSLVDSVGGGSSSSASDSGQRFTKFAADQIPHTLMRKPVAEGRLTSPFGKRRNPTSWIGFPKLHAGIDYGAPTGTPVYASGNGVVVQRRVSDSYGNVVKIEHANGFATLYAHLDTFADALKVGNSVSRGQQIGTVGSTGRSTAPHLHYELYYKDKKVNPLYKLPGADGA